MNEHRAYERSPGVTVHGQVQGQTHFHVVRDGLEVREVVRMRWKFGYAELISGFQPPREGNANR